MKVFGLAKSTDGGSTRVTANVTWEDCDRPDRTIFIETDARFSDDLDASPDAFLLATFIPAMHHGERRVSIEGPVCPQLRNGLATAAQVLRRWYGDADNGPVRIEPTRGFRPTWPTSPARHAAFLSGGVDALATLRSNRLDFPLDHPVAIRDCFFVHGMDVGGYEHLPPNRAHAAVAIASLARLADHVEATLIPVHTNLRHLDDGDMFFHTKYYGSVLAAIAHVFPRRITTAMIASGSSVRDLGPIGSHPLLDPNFGSGAVRVEHDGLRYSRLDKVRLISEWDEALQTLRSCFDPFRPPEALNCGECEKCLRTMTELLVCDGLRHCRTYPLDDVTPDVLQTIVADPTKERNAVALSAASTAREATIGLACRRLNNANVHYWEELIDPLTRLGRRDLVDVIAPKLSTFWRLQAWKDETDWKGSVKRLDRRYLGGVTVKGLRGVEGIFRAALARARSRRETS